MRTAGNRILPRAGAGFFEALKSWKERGDVFENPMRQCLLEISVKLWI